LSINFIKESFHNGKKLRRPSSKPTAALQFVYIFIINAMYNQHTKYGYLTMQHFKKRFSLFIKKRKIHRKTFLNANRVHLKFCTCFTHSVPHSFSLAPSPLSLANYVSSWNGHKHTDNYKTETGNKVDIS